MTSTLNTKLNIEGIKDYMREARELSGSVTGYFAREVLPELRGGIQKIGQDKNLTTQGKHEKKEKYKKQQEVAVMRGLSNIKGAYDNFLADARASAEAILLSNKDIAKPTENEQRLFDMQADKLKTAILFAPTVQAKITALESFSQLASEGEHFAKQVHADFMQMSAEAIGSAKDSVERTAFTQALGRINTQLEAQSTSPTQKEASQLLASVKQMQNTAFVNTIVLENALKEISMDTLKYANDIDGYFTAKAEAVQNYDRDAKFGHLIK
ncbi:hypothetical protein OCF62_11865 [Bacillus wiedmannii]|uniref:hypothetical protein n=1 Tax=Bacillus wiedmannii TaxID=1890302 RepID=UPI000BF9B31A|nr:hypothetical protein [Bacillus wiedmannii]MCU5515270.1 hypothetical protein [Bacillus wiedmannii]PEW70456.1 hypothetical protein CN424_25330 [Bacillus cereus]